MSNTCNYCIVSSYWAKLILLKGVTHNEFYQLLRLIYAQITIESYYAISCKEGNLVIYLVRSHQQMTPDLAKDLPELIHEQVHLVFLNKCSQLSNMFILEDSTVC